MPSNVTTILLVDDHGLVLRGFRRLLEDEPDLSVVGEASDGPEAVEAAKRLRPDVVVMDFSLPSMNGAVATKLILAAVPDIAVLMLSMHSEPSYVRASLAAGAPAYLLKSAMDLELVSVIREVVSGGQLLDPRIELSSSATANVATPFSPRELEVLELIVHGKSNREIAVEVGLSANTVSVHRAHIMKALAIHKTADLVVIPCAMDL